jgi:hypothetical protein
MSELEQEPVDGVEPVEDAEPAWSGPTEEQWLSTQAQLAEAAALVEAVRAGQNQDGPLSGYDPEFRQELDQYINQKLSPYQSFQQDAILGEAEQRAQDILHDDAVRNGEFDTQTARLRADHLLPDMTAKYGPGPKAAEAALAAAAKEQRDYEKQMYDKAVDQYTNRMRGISTAPREPAAGGAVAGAQHVTPQGGDELDLVRAHFPSGR